MDWERDSSAIWADFRIWCRLDLRTVPFLHWFDFMALFKSLPPESAVKRRMTIRGIDLAAIQDSRAREEYRRLKASVALDRPEEPDYWPTDCGYFSRS